MAKPVQLKMILRALFAMNSDMRARWGSMDSHPIANAKIMVEGTALYTRSMIYGSAQMDVSSLSSGDYVLALTPDMGDLLKTSSEPVCSSDGNKNDAPGKCRYRPLRIKVSLKVTEDRVEVTGAEPCDGVSHGRVSYLPQTGLTIDWRPDWVACKHSGPRPSGIAPSLILLHRTEASTPGSTLDSFRSSKESSHYLVDVDGHVIKLVHEGLIANHAGSSFWNDQTHVNSRSIGIEIVNAGGDFSLQQYTSIIRLIRISSRPTQVFRVTPFSRMATSRSAVMRDWMITGSPCRGLKKNSTSHDMT